MFLRSLAVALLFLLAVHLNAPPPQGLDGTWTGEIAGEGKTIPFDCTFHVTGNSFTGTHGDPDGWPIREGNINGSKISYKTGNPCCGGAPDAVHVTGVLNGDTLELTIDVTDAPRGERFSVTLHRKK